MNGKTITSRTGQFSFRSIAFSAGSLLSTVDDMAKWDAALSSGKSLKKSSLDQIWTPAVTNDGADPSFNYGFGWFLDSYHGHRLVQHSGGTPGFSSLIYRFIDDKLTIIVLTNHCDMIMDQLAIDLAGICLPALKRPEAKPDPNPMITAKSKEIVSGLLKGNYEPAAFTGADACVPKHCDGQGILEMVRLSWHVGLVCFL